MITIPAISSEIKSRLETPGIKAKPKALAAFSGLRRQLVQCKTLARAAELLANHPARATAPRKAIEVYIDGLLSRVNRQLAK